VLAWIGALSWLVLREYRPATGAEYGASAEIQLPPTTTFYALHAGADQVGFRSITTDTVPNGVRITSRIDVDVPLPLVPRRLLMTTETLYDERFRLLGFTTTVSGEAGQQTLVATVEADSLLSVVISGRGQTRPDTVVLQLPSGALLPDAVSIWLATGGKLKPGAVARVPVLDPVELTLSEWNMRVSAESVFVVADSAASDSATGAWIPAGLDTIQTVGADWLEYGMPVRAWIDRQGSVIARETPLGLTERRGPYEIVNSGYARRRPRNVQAAPLEVPTPLGVATAPSRVSLGPVNLRSAATMLTTPWQAAVGDQIESRYGPLLSPNAPLPLADSIRAGYSQSPTSAFIVSETRRIAGADTATHSRAVSRLAAWVGSAIVPGPPTVGDVERTLLLRRGDSSDRAALLVAMARSLGIPARPVAGLLSTGGRLRYRAWAEVWLGVWLPVDPTLGQFPADPGHFRLLIDATARPSTIVSLLGAVRPTLTNATAP